MKSLKENEMIESIKVAEKNKQLDKFALAGYMNGGSIRIFRCTIDKYSDYEILVKAPCFFNCGKVFHKSEDDNRFYCMDDGGFWALCLNTEEADSISKTYSETNEFCRNLSTKMKLLTIEELQPIAVYLEGCFERRFI